MNEPSNSQGTSAEIEKPVQVDDVKFPLFPDPTDEDFDEDIAEEERNYYKSKFSDVKEVASLRLHCSACDRHLGSSTRNESRMRAHPMLRTVVCNTCHTFYNSGEFEKGDDGSELYCRWCGQGGQVYCCSDCPHVFCAKCIKRNFGMPKIKEIENTDDWKCFRCNPRPLWDLRAICWALLRYCDLKNKITYKTEDPQLKEAYQRDCAKDYTVCCKSRNRRREKSDVKNIKKETDTAKKPITNALPKLPSTIQVKKFASISATEDSFKEKKPSKRPASPARAKSTIFIKNPIPITGTQNIINPVVPPLKKIRMPMLSSIRFAPEKKIQTYPRIKPRPHFSMPISMVPSFNGFSSNNIMGSDNINLSLENLTQGLDMAAVVAMSNNSSMNNADDDVVCTPDFPLEPLCEVTEDNNDDDVQCMTPVPAPNRKVKTPPLVTSRNLVPDNIIQMTENDVTVNSATGGLKFRVDPQTLSSNKMYRLPDGRVFAINANPNMPGGYSATIVAVTEGKNVPKGPTTFNAKLSSIPPAQTSTPAKSSRSSENRASGSKGKNDKNQKVNTGTHTQRECDLEVPVEWYRYNLVDALDALEYSCSRLKDLKKQATTTFLRTRTIDEMKCLHKILERLLNTSSTRFNEIRSNLNQDLKKYLAKKAAGPPTDDDDDDDDVEIVPDLENEDPIFIDENSMESTINELCSDSQDTQVDLTGVGSSDHNDSSENKNDNSTVMEHRTTTNIEDNLVCDKSNRDKESHSNENVDDSSDSQVRPSLEGNDKDTENVEESAIPTEDITQNLDSSNVELNSSNPKSCPDAQKDGEEVTSNDETHANGVEQAEDNQDDKVEEECSKEENEKISPEDLNICDNDSKIQDAEMSEELIEKLLKDDNTNEIDNNPDEIDNMLACKAMDVVESV